MAELADAYVWGAYEHTHMGSSPIDRTNKETDNYVGFFVVQRDLNERRTRKWPVNNGAPNKFSTFVGATVNTIIKQ